MALAFLGFLNISFVDALDILMVAFIIYFVFRWIQGSSAMNIFVAILLLFIIKVVVSTLNMKLMSGLMTTVLDVGVIALIVIFQPEIRFFLIKIGGDKGIAGSGRKLMDRVLGIKHTGIDDGSVTELTEAVKVMAEQKTGALVVISRRSPLQKIIETGDTIDARINRRLILNLFFKNSPLHDGAVILSADRIVAARCTLPLTGKTDIPARYGMRHKAAIGITEESDAVVVVVSEETGGVSFVKDGIIRPVSDIARLKEFLAEEEGTDGQETKTESGQKHGTDGQEA